MRVAITGGTGFVGSHLAWALVREGHRVVLIARGLTAGRRSFFDCKAPSLSQAM